jgi:hypothetical protein
MMILGLFCWFVCGVGGAGFLKANEDVNFPNHVSRRQQREAIGFWLLFSFAGPITLLVAWFWTGFGVDGWSLSTTPVRRKAD